MALRRRPLLVYFPSALFALESKLVAAGRGSPNMSGQTLVETLRASGMPLDVDEYGVLLRDLDPSGRGSVDARRFLENVRVSAPRLRLSVCAVAVLSLCCRCADLFRVGV